MHRRLFTILVLSALFPSLAFSEEAPDQDPAGTVQEQTEEPQVPPDHPALAPKPGFELPPVPEGAGDGDTGLSWATPENWIEEEPANAMRRAQYRIPGEAGDGECVVFYFGPGQGGDPLANAERWGSQFLQPDGSPASEALITKQIDVGGVPILTCEITGDYGGGMRMGRPAEVLENHMLLGAIAQGPDANWFFKFTGPQATVEANRPAFEGLLNSLSIGDR